MKRSVFAMRVGTALANAALVSAALVSAALVGLAGCSASNELQGQLIAAWRDGDEAFRKTQFDAAIKEYKFIGQRIRSQGGNQWQADRELAEALVVLCESLQSADTELANNRLPEAKLTAIQQSCDRVKELAPATTEVPKELELGGRTAGRAFSPAERVADVAGWARQRLESWHSRWKPEKDARQRWEDAERLLSLAKKYATADTVWQGVAAEQQRLRVVLDGQEKMDKLRAALQACLQEPSRESYEVARTLYEELAAVDTPELGAKAAWEAFRGDLRPALREAARPRERSRLGSRMTSRSLDRLPLDVACALNRELLDLPADPGSPLVFALTADRCYAVEARGGRPRWALRIGYGPRHAPLWIPGEMQSLVALAWGAGKARHVSVVQAVDGEPLWTATLPEEVELSGPLISAGGGLYALLERGELWRFDPATGELQGVLVFPEPVAGPLVVDSDGRRGLVLGRDMAGYIVPLELPVRAESAFLLEDDTRYEDTHGLWASPYVILVRNTTAGRAEVHVLAEPGKEREGVRLQRHELAGRVWQPPALHANQLLMSTDSGEEIVLGIDVNQPQSPLYELHRRAGAPAGTEVAHPICAVHPDGGFLVARPGNCEAWTLDVLNRAGVKRQSLWQSELEKGEIPSQPWQFVGGRIYTVTQRPGRSGARLRSFDSKTGQVEWLRTMGVNAVEVVHERRVTNGKCMALVWTSGDSWRLFDSSATGVIAGRALDWAATNASLEYAPRSRRIAWIESHPRIQLSVARVVAGGLEVERSWKVDHEAAAPLAAWEGAIGPNPPAAAAGESPPENFWLAGIDSGRRLLLGQTQYPDRPPQFQNLPANLPNADWYRPVWWDGSGIVVAHPRGHLLAATVDVTGRLPFLRHAASTLVSDQGLLGRPVRIGNRVWALDRAGTIWAREWPSLVPQGEVATGPPGTPLVAADRRVYVGLRDGAVMAVSVEGDAPGRVSRLSVSDEPLVQLAWDEESNRLIAVDVQGHVFWVRAGGVVQRVGSVSSAATVPPWLWHDAVHVLTEGGTVESVLLSGSP
ncbi:MAG: hypothetical protein U0935_22825 [Pirellulales bacterium]